VARTRTTKKLAQRIDLNYFKRPTAFKRARLWLSVLVPVVALVWIAWRGYARDSRVYSSGQMSAAHAVLEPQCGVCHVKNASAYSSKAADSACLACHDGPEHHAGIATPAGLNCATCHAEHRGRITLTAASNESCAECHGDLKLSSGASSYTEHIRSLEDGHPEFWNVRRDRRANWLFAQLKFSHASHMKSIRHGPNGPAVQLECGDCHRTWANSGVTFTYDARYSVPPTNWHYGDPAYVSVKPSYKQDPEPARDATVTAPRYSLKTGSELMAPVLFAKSCAGCHVLSFDARFSEGVPHDTPEVIHDFVIKKFTDYIAAHPEELRAGREPKRDLTSMPNSNGASVLTPAQWVAERTSEAEYLLWKKTCVECHTLAPWAAAIIESRHHTPYPPMTPEEIRHFIETSGRPDQYLEPAYSQLPNIWGVHTTPRWFSRANFDHDAHRSFSCEGCHPKALTSTQVREILVPGIATCQTCHAPGPEHAESRCFECHTYHDWSKRKEVKAEFTLPALVDDKRGRAE
jgi:hypothetical protein